MRGYKNNIYLQGVLVGIIGIIAVAIMLSVNVSQIGADVDTSAVTSVLLQSSIQVFFISFLSWILGRTLAAKMGLKVDLEINKKEIKNAIYIGVLIAVGLMTIDKFILKVFMQEYEMLASNLFGRLYQVIYSGFIEEIWFRLGGVTLISYSINTLIFKKNKDKISLSILIGIISTVVLFYLINLLNIQRIYYLYPVVIAKTIIQFMIPPIVYSVIYWKKGLLYSIITHLTMVTVLNFILVPIVVNL